jgi:hypothetical protein
MVRVLRRSLPVAVASLLFASPAGAQVVQSVHVGAGAFLPRGLDSRAEGDVLVENLITTDPLTYRIGDFRNAEVFGEWLVSFGDRVEAGAGLGYFAVTVASEYRDLEHENGFPIRQDLRLRVTPISAVIRFLPFGRPSDVQPYVGAGVGALNWRYSEVGEFVDPDLNVFAARFTATGTDPGALLLGGVRLPLRGDIYGLTAEYRYQFGQGDTGGFDKGFLGDTIDLSGGDFRVGFLVRF